MAAQLVLVVDDEKNIRLMVETALERAGYQVDLAVDGQHALTKMATQPYDLILLDLKLPDVDGMEVLRQIKQRWPGQAVVMLTAHGSIETAVEAMKLGAVDYVQKPLTPGELTAMIGRVLARRRLAVDKPAADVATLTEQAKLLLERRQPGKALTYLQQAIALQPQQAEPFNLLGATYELMGEVDSARKMYRAALSIDPTYRPAATNLDRISQWGHLGGAVQLEETDETGESSPPEPRDNPDHTSAGAGHQG